MKIHLIVGCACVAAFVSPVRADIASGRIVSEGDYPPHLQGVCTDGTNLWWSHTVELTRTDLNGKVLAHAKKLRSHHGDLCIVDGTLYVAVNHGKFNTEDKADSWVYAYKGDDLTFIKRWKVPELVHGSGGMTWYAGHFYVVGGLPPTHDENYVYEYTPDFTFVKRHVLNSGWTCLGIQTTDCSGGRFYFGCYGGRNATNGKHVHSLTLISPLDLSSVEKVEEATAIGIIRLNGRMWKAGMKNVNPEAEKRERRYQVHLEPVKSAKINASSAK